MLLGLGHIRFGVLALSCILVAGDDVCENEGDPGCAGPFPPGHYNIGQSWWAIGKKSFNASILSLTAELSVPVAPDTLDGIMLINPAMENANINDWDDVEEASEVYQVMTGAWPWDACHQAPDQWCMFPSSYSKAAETPEQYSVGKTEIVDTDQSILLNYTYSPDGIGGGLMTVEAAVDGSPGHQVSNYTNQAPWQMWLKTECMCEFGIHNIPAHSYYNLDIVLDIAVPNFLDSISSSHSVMSVPTTIDGGKTWTIESIDVYAGLCENNESCEDGEDPGDDGNSNYGDDSGSDGGGDEDDGDDGGDDGGDDEGGGEDNRDRAI